MFGLERKPLSPTHFLLHVLNDCVPAATIGVLADIYWVLWKSWNDASEHVREPEHFPREWVIVDDEDATRQVPARPPLPTEAVRPATIPNAPWFSARLTPAERKKKKNLKLDLKKAARKLVERDKLRAFNAAVHAPPLEIDKPGPVYATNYAQSLEPTVRSNRWMLAELSRRWWSGKNHRASTIYAIPKTADRIVRANHDPSRVPTTERLIPPSDIAKLRSERTIDLSSWSSTRQHDVLQHCCDVGHVFALILARQTVLGFIDAMKSEEHIDFELWCEFVSRDTTLENWKLLPDSIFGFGFDEYPACVAVYNRVSKDESHRVAAICNRRFSSAEPYRFSLRDYIDDFTEGVVTIPRWNHVSVLEIY